MSDSTSKKPFCCHIDYETEENCGEDAKWNIHVDGDAPELVTQMCDKHLHYHCNDKGWTRVWPVDEEPTLGDLMAEENKRLDEED